MSVNFCCLLVGVVFCRIKNIVERHKPELKLAALILAAFVSSEYIKSISTSAEYLVCAAALLKKYGRIVGIRLD